VRYPRLPRGPHRSAGGVARLNFLKQLLALAHELLEAEKETPAAEDEDRGTAALTELFEHARNPETPVIVERVVADIDEIFRLVRWLITVYGKNEADDLTPTQKAQLRTAIEVERKIRQARRGERRRR